MGLILTATAGLCLWIILWSLNISGFDAILIAVVMVLVAIGGAQPAPVPARPAGLDCSMRRAQRRLLLGRRAPGLVAALTHGRACRGRVAAAPAAPASPSPADADDLRQLRLPVRGTQMPKDVLDAERLAFQQKQSEVSGIQALVRHVGRAKLRTTPAPRSRTPSSIAYLGELAPGRSADCIGITNAQELLQVSPPTPRSS